MLYVREYIDIGSTSRGSIPIPAEPASRTQTLEVSAGSIQSEPFGPQTCLVTLLSDEDCLYEVGTDPDASKGGGKLIAKIEKVISVLPGRDTKIAVTAANVESVSKMNNMDSLESLVKLLASPAEAQKQFAVMAANTDKMNVSAEALRKASEENAAIRDQLIVATNDALNAKAEAGKAAADITSRGNALERSLIDHNAQVKSDKAAYDQREGELDEREVSLAVSQTALNKLGSDLNDRAGNLDAKEKDLIAREAAATALQADYEARVAKLKALTA